MELEIKHLAPYLQYYLKLQYIIRGEVVKTGVMRSINHNPFETHPTKISLDFGEEEHIWMFKPIFRPIQEVEQYFEDLYGRLENQDVTDYFDADFLASHDNIEISEIQLLEPEQIPYGTIQVLLKHHFDIFGLIEKGLAIDINTLSVQNDG